MYGLFQGIQQILLPAQVDQIDSAAKVGNLALLTTLAAIASMVALPIGGAVSDRTRSRFGRRTPWMVVMSALSALLLIAMGSSPNLFALAISYMLLWFVANFYQAAISAILPDRVPVERRGVASAVIGLGTPLGILFAVNLVSRVSQFWGYTTIALIFLAATLALVLGSKEDSSIDLALEPKNTTENAPRFIASFFAAFAARDFRLAFISRAALFLSYFTVSGYLYYTVQDYVGLENLPTDNLAVAVSTLSTISVITWTIVATAAGWLADRLDRRKLFVGVSAVGMGLSMLAPIISPTWTGMIIYAVLSGAFVGVYFAVDLAVMSLVLPDKANEGRDFGILAVATGLPQILSSVIAGALITFLGGYIALYLFGALSAVVSGLVILRVRSVR
ncbi:MFS transporter [Rhodococcus sp. 06-156-3C]|uniref:MFS transporter n=2 Tax=Nocardiaceae TaxID=85025 RepID=UPI0009B81B18|nr:MFS transporter [Rhodococcus fascians]OZD18210.1 MFS transporter [Rhodococcus sp. 06-156-4C]OZD18807.1 MFS transporter [Rhodococcus sp. 06-156-3C]OZD22317.1 MFS transporter [Rhodococcus sp. 06-156-4a]OZD34123.1 MFS transporter [Rhodococcus sp. 06-156-3b]OZD38860.1 MFS transporter [Rhodococcus sp. 06-156-3]OZF57320.1 MFS transporter [Rhodococcus sp. 06-156-4]